MLYAPMQTFTYLHKIEDARIWWQKSEVYLSGGPVWLGVVVPGGLVGSSGGQAGPCVLEPPAAEDALQ